MREKSNWDKKVQVRYNLLRSLERALNRAKQGDKTLLKQQLRAIDNMDDYKVVLNSELSIYERKFSKEDKVIAIYENQKLMFTIYKNKRSGDVWVDFDDCDLRTERELIEISKSEIEAERKMSMWANGYRPHLEYMDDPRGH